MSEIALANPGEQPVVGAPAGFAPRKRTVQLGSAFMTGAAVMYFSGLFGIYVSTRNAHIGIQDALEAAGESTTPWIPSSAQVELASPTVMTWTLLMSLVTMQWAVYSFKRDDRRHGLLALGVTAMFGTAVINQVSFQWGQLGLAIDEVSGTAAATLIYTITASHVAMIVAALAMLALAGFKALASSKPSLHLDSVVSAAVFWYAMVGLYFIIWILIFITK